MRFLIFLAAAIIFAQEGKVHQPVKYKHVYLEEEAKTKTILEFYVKTNCAGDAAKIEEFHQFQTLPDDETGRSKDIRVFNIYATLLPSGGSCKGEKEERLVGSYKVPVDSKHKSRLYITLEGWLILRVSRYK